MSWILPELGFTNTISSSSMVKCMTEFTIPNRDEPVTVQEGRRRWREGKENEVKGIPMTFIFEAGSHISGPSLNRLYSS